MSERYWCAHCAACIAMTRRRWATIRRPPACPHCGHTDWRTEPPDPPLVRR